MTTTQIPTHRVVAAATDGRYVTVPQLTNLDWRPACAAWNTLDDARRAGRLPLVSYLVIRSEDDPDPRWAMATNDLGPLVVGRQRGTVDADRAIRTWGKAHGYIGRPGGYIDRVLADGRITRRPVCQGWGALANRVAAQFPTVKADGRYYVNDLDGLAVVATEVA